MSKFWDKVKQALRKVDHFFDHAIEVGDEVEAALVVVNPKWAFAVGIALQVMRAVEQCTPELEDLKQDTTGDAQTEFKGEDKMALAVRDFRIRLDAVGVQPPTVEDAKTFLQQVYDEAKKHAVK